MHCCFEAGQRIGLFDGLSTTAAYDSTENNSTEPPSGTLPLLIPAKHVALISSVRSSPPPDLGLPIAPADAAAAGNPDGPPVLEPELDGAARGGADAVTAEGRAADRSALLTSVPPADSENGVIIIE